MPKPSKIEILDRRQFSGGVLAAALLPALIHAVTASAQEKSAAPGVAGGEKFDDVLSRLTKGMKPVEGKLGIELPEIAENGNVVPFTITADSPMTEASHIRAIHLLSTENPQPLVSTYRFTPSSGKAIVGGRMRLARTQEVVVLAETGDGKLWMSRTKVKVTVGGCGG